MSVLGELVVRIVGDSSDLIKNLDKAKDSINRTGQLFNKIGGLISAGMTHPLVDFGIKSVKAAAESEKASASLAAAIRATGKETQISVKAIEDLAGELQNFTTYEDDAIVSAAGLLQSIANLNEDGLKKLLPVITDVAAGLRIDLESAASMVGRTLAGERNPFKTYGIEIKEGANKTERLANLIEALNGKWGDTAKAIANSGLGQLQITQNLLNNAMEDFGKLLIGPIQGGLALFNSAIKGGWSEFWQTSKMLGEQKIIKSISNDLLNQAKNGKTLSLVLKETAGFQTVNIEKIREVISQNKELNKTYNEQNFIMIKNAKIALERLVSGGVLTESFAAKAQKRLDDLLKMYDSIIAKNVEAQETIEIDNSKFIEESAKSFDKLGENLSESAKKVIDGVKLYNDESANSFALAGSKIKDAASRIEQTVSENQKTINQWAKLAVNSLVDVGQAMGEALVTGADGWRELQKVAVLAIAGIVDALAQEFAIKAAGSFAEGFINPAAFAAAGAYTAAAITASVASGVIKALAIPKAATGGYFNSPYIGGEAGAEFAIPDKTRYIDLLADKISIAMNRPVNNVFQPNINFPNSFILKIGENEFYASLSDASRNGRFLVDRSRGLAR